MREGARYPELQNMQLDPIQLTQRVEPVPDWTLAREDMMTRWRAATVRTTQIPGVRITMPLEDFERLMSIYTSHYHAASRNPAVADAWQQYKMLVALTER